MKKTILMTLGVSMWAASLFAGDPVSRPVDPKEGMWLPHLVKALNIGEMQQLGFRLTADDIYSINQSSLKDAVVQLGGFCTAEVVSSQGLLFTNHHCAYDAIQTHSSVDHDYLTDGFWAKTKAEELHTPGLTVSFLVRIEDVSQRINDAVKGLEGPDRDAKIAEEIAAVEEGVEKEKGYRAEVNPMFAGNEFYLFVYETFSDIRLVGAPPSSIGKFGGDTDNWMWPRHTGDFSVLRVYAGPDNKPADYSAENVPYKPKHFLPVSVKGIKNGDFSMTMGYPGSTERYLTSFAVEQAYKNDNPTIVKLLGERLNIMKEHMDASDKVRIQLASGYASLANTHKYYIGQNRGLDHSGLIAEKQKFEREFTNWLMADASRREKYSKVLDMSRQNYANSTDVLKLSAYLNMAGFAPGCVGFGVNLWRLQGTMAKEPDNKEAWQPAIDRTKGAMEGHFKDYDAPTDERILAAMCRFMYNDLPAKYHPSVFTSKAFTKSKPKGDMDRFDVYAAKVFSTSVITDEARLKAFLANPSKKVLDADLGVAHVASIIQLYREKMAADRQVFDATNEEVNRLFVAAIREMNPAKKFYPDANFTMRLSYGSIMPYDPRDGVSYLSQTFADGIIEKEVPNDEEFHVPAKLHDLIVKKDFGRYGQNGRLPICFTSDNDITGGNSGSPVINGDGHLIGIAFDGNWESMTGDLVFDPNVQRTISVDIRYVLFVIEKYAGATNLIDELKVMQ